MKKKIRIVLRERGDGSIEYPPITFDSNIETPQVVIEDASGNRYMKEIAFEKDPTSGVERAVEHLEGYGYITIIKEGFDASGSRRIPAD